ncbi:putative chromate transport protein [Andreesenia angusta]|uniref:Putative chromate transport protein n=1 Tax=Andreesenia angusta TaxID=39480 RepID=A0A1S1V6C3_9FIRM|nr:chromate transporter [Andreesenia angusta]OHW61920.1 putative chromate transport protein [Andreesenia angusta]
MIYWGLFLSFFKIGLFSFGGGYAMIPLIQNEVIEVNSWLSQAEFLDMLAIAQVTPGPIAINTATFVGQRVAGIPGAVTTTFAVVFPSFVIVLILAYLVKRIGESKQMDYIYKGLRPVVLALILSALVSIGRESITGISTAAIAVLGFLALRYKKLNMVMLLILSGLLGVFFY